MGLRYGSEWGDNWLLQQQGFDGKSLAKFESIFAQGNGSLGVRAALEENYETSVRNSFISGCFNQEHQGEVTELVNLPDLFNFQLSINGERLNLNEMTGVRHTRTLNLKSGITSRVLRAPEQWQLETERFVSMANRESVAQKLLLKVEKPTKVDFSYCIDGRSTNSGAQHLFEQDRRVIDHETLSLTSATTQSGRRVQSLSSLSVFVDGRAVTDIHRFSLDRRRPVHRFTVELQPGQCLELHKIGSTYVEDLPLQPSQIESFIADKLTAHRKLLRVGYGDIKQDHIQAWRNIWQKYDVIIEGVDFDQLAIRFAIYHMLVMTPSDGMSGIGAKGLSGEGYRGHSFWDTEIFLLPFFGLNEPQISRALLHYRMHTLDGAVQNSGKNGFKGAMFPWESADSGDEVTPKWGPLDVESGKPIEVLCGFLEQHVTADVAYAVSQYYRQTQDKKLMIKGGYRLLLETARFWVSRVTWSETREQYVINHIIGPDEYTEKVDNNAYTNYLVKENLEAALSAYEEVNSDPYLMALIYESIPTIEDDIDDIRHTLEFLRLQKVNQDHIIPQDDTYLSLPQFDLSAYKGNSNVGSVLTDFNIDQLSQFQVGKQADVVMLFHLFPDRWDKTVVEKCWEYYESRCLHDSSLSYAIYASVAARLGKINQAYNMFRKASSIDLGEDINSSNDGIHAASFGGMWQTTILGFAGVNLSYKTLEISPQLPEQWSRLCFSICWQQARLRVEVKDNQVLVFLVEGPMPQGQLIVHGENKHIIATEECIKEAVNV